MLESRAEPVGIIALVGEHGPGVRDGIEHQGTLSAHCEANAAFAFNGVKAEVLGQHTD